mgnify:CR=1 FL=1
MNCKQGDIVMVIRSEMDNAGRIGRIVARAVPGTVTPCGAVAYPGDDWVVEGRFSTADEIVMSYGGRPFFRCDVLHRTVHLLPFPDAWLRPIRGDGLTEDTSTDISKPERVEA